MAFIKAKRTMGVKIESTPYTEETLAASDYSIPWNDIEYSPEIQMYARKIARGHMSWDPSIAGKRELKITARHDFYVRDTALGTAPKWGVTQRMCGLKETVYAGTGVGYVPHADYTRVPGTIHIQERDEGASPSDLVIRGRGGMGNCKYVLDSVGRPLSFNYDFRSVLTGIEDRAYASIITPTITDTDLPDAVLSSTITLFGETQKLDKFTIDLGNDVQLFTDPSKSEGYEGAHIVGRNISLELDPDMDLIANRGDYARWTGDTTGAMVVTVGTNAQLIAPAVQYIKAYNPQEREGHVTNQKNCELKGGPAGNDEFEILQGTKI